MTGTDVKPYEDNGTDDGADTRALDECVGAGAATDG